MRRQEALDPAPASASRAPVLVLGTADWNQPIATNQHYMARELARVSDVWFVESLGLRRPELTGRDLRRIVRRVRRKPRVADQGRPIPPRVRVVSPKIIPFHDAPWSIPNRVLLHRQVGDWARSGRARVFWTYSPVTYGLEVLATRSVYHCVDLYREFPGIDARLVDRAERALADTEVVAIGSSEKVVEHLEQQGFSTVLYWPNVADTELITRVEGLCNPAERRGAVFAGNLSDKKVDFALLRELAIEGIELHIAGPVAEGGGQSQAEVDELVRLGAKYHGLLGLAEVAELMKRCRVGLIPYQLNPYTRGVSPLKTYEYLAAGLSVVSTALPGVTQKDEDVFVESTNQEAVARIREQLEQDPGSRIPERVRTAREHSWAGRGVEARELVDRLLQERREL